MKRSPARLCLAAIAFLPPLVQADTAWSADAAGSWGLASNWNPATVPSGTGETVRLEFDLTSNRTITLDATRTVGSLAIGDPAAPFANYTLNTGTTGSLLVFDAAGVSEALLHYPVAASGAANSISAGITLLDQLEIRSDVTTSAAQSLSGSITGAFRIRKTGPGSVTLIGSSSTYSGGTLVEAGRLNVGRASSLGSGLVTVADGGTLATTSTSATISNSLSLAGLGCVDVATGARLGALRLANNNILSGAVSLASPARVSAYASTGTISGVISGSHGLELGWKQPADSFSTNSGGTITLTGANTHSGGTHVANAIVKAGNASALGTGAVTVESATESTARSQSVLELGNGFTFPNALTLGENAGADNAGALSVAAGNSATWSGPVSITGEPAKGGHFAAGSGGLLTVSGPITATGKSVLQAAGSVAYAGGGSYSSLKLSGTAKVGAAAGIPSSASVTLGAFAQPGVLDLNGFALTLAGLQGGTAGGSVTTVTAATLTVDSSAPSAFSGSFSGPVALVKTGPATLTLGPSFPEGGVELKSGRILLGSPSLPDTYELRLTTGSVLELAHGDYDSISVLRVDGLPQPDGLWGAIGSGAQHETALIAGPGFLQVGAITDPYLLWLQGFPGLSAAQKVRTADADSDGLPNLLELYYGLSPVSADLSPPLTAAFQGGEVTVTFRRADSAAGFGARVQKASSPAGPWADVAAVPGVVDDYFGVGVDAVQVTFPSEGAQSLFVRLRVE